MNHKQVFFIEDEKDVVDLYSMDNVEYLSKVDTTPSAFFRDYRGKNSSVGVELSYEV